MLTEATTTVRVRYSETDQMRVAYYGHFFVWFEIGRVELFRQMGFRYRDMEEQDDSYIVVAEARCSYKKPARYDDPLRIRTCVLEVRRRTLRFGYEVFHDETGDLVARGETVHVICDHRGRPKSLPEKYRRVFSLAEAGGQEDTP